jgi:hypothetical protein
MTFSTPPSRLLINLPRHPRHLPHLALLRKISTRLRPRASTARRDHGNLKHRRVGVPRSASRLLWHLHPTRQRSLSLQSERNGTGRSSPGGPRPLESDMGCIHFQRQHCLSLLNVSLPTPHQLHHHF